MSLTSLNLSLASFGLAPNIIQSIASAFGYLQNLVNLKLDLSGICTTDPDQIQQFSSSLKTLKASLKFLDLNFSELSPISDPTLQNLAEAVRELALLKHLSLAFNRANGLTNRGLEAISLAIRDLSNLSDLALSLSNNQEINNLAPLSQALRQIPSLYSVKFDFGRCLSLKYEGNGLKNLFNALREINNWRSSFEYLIFSRDCRRSLQVRAP